MSTLKQIEANRLNAEKSPGPKSVPALAKKEERKDLLKHPTNEALEPLLMVQVNRTTPKGWPAEQQMDLACAMQTMVQPRDDIEALLGAQMVAVHNLAMDFMARANHPGQPSEAVAASIGSANKLLRTYMLQMEALNRHRGKGQQKVTVEHVTVNQGGQAVIGNVEQPGGGGGHGKK